jgi:tryptophanyl-tRNA synthetase
MTKEDLEQIGKLLEAERVYTRKIVQEVVEVNNKVLGTILKVELAETKQEIAATMKTGFQETAKQIKRVEQKLEKTLEDHEERIEQLEEHTSIHKN